MASPCDQYITQPKRIGVDEYPFVGKFSPKKEISLASYNGSNGTEPLFVFLHISVTGPLPTVINDTAQESAFRMVAYDSENEYDTLNRDFNETVPSFEQSLFYINKHTLVGRLLYKFGYTRKIRNTLVNSPLNYIGLPPMHHSTSYIESVIQDSPMSSTNKDYVTLRISPQSFMLAVESEQRNDSIISILGTIAAFYSTIVFVYVFLFGVDSVSPWGIVHKGCCGLYGFRSKTVAAVSRNVSPSNIDDLKERIKALEKFKQVLQNNVVDFSIIEA